MSTPIPKTPIKFLWYVSRPQGGFALFAILMATLGQLTLSLTLYPFKEMTDGFIAANDSTTAADTFVTAAGAYVLLTALSFLFWRLSGFIGMEWLTRTNVTAYQTLYGYVSKHSHSYFIDRFAGALSNKISNASDGSSRMLERALWGWYPEIVGVAMGFALIFTVDPWISVALIGTLIFAVFSNLYLVRIRRPHAIAYSNASSTLRGEGVDFLSNVLAVRHYARFPFELGRFSESLNDRRHKDIKQWRLSEWSISFNNLVTVGLITGVLVYLYTLILSGSATPGGAVLVLLVLSRVSGFIVFIGNTMNGFIREYAEIEEGLKTVLADHEIVDSIDAKPLEVNDAGIKWQNAIFEYGDKRVFNEFDLTIPAGQRVGLVGPSGAGKSTFVSLLLRQHNLNSGEILIGGQNIAKVTQDSLRENIAVVPQEPILFHRSIRENIAYGKVGATDEEIMTVARLANAHDFIKDLSEGYDTLVGERGVKLSGGQKQRIAIARAMLKDAPILLLDEATSALDSESEVAIQKALHKLMEGKTVIAIAHRLSTLREMDRIIVLENGKIVEDGSHTALLEYDGVYSRLWKHQAGGFLQE